MNSCRPDPYLAIIIPVFRHSAVVQEALASVLDQHDLACKLEIIIVDDGCPLPQTPLTLSCLPSSYQNVHYIRQINAGLSAARNSGVRFVLDRFPSCEAIYFLDADNRLSPQSINACVTALLSRDADWFYPNIHMFGLVWKGDYSGPFRRLTETLMNICEAGSLVRISIFKAGVFFDEKMRDGYEDWDFWLQAIRLGFRGEHLPRLGLQYRKRTESMLSDSTRLHDAIVNYIEKKHDWLRKSCIQTTIEHLDAPRYAIVDVSSNTVRLTSDPNYTSERLSFDQYRLRLRASSAHPNRHAVGAFLIFTSSVSQEALHSRGLLRFALWDLELHLLAAPFSSISIRQAKDTRIQTEIARPNPCEPLHIVGMSIKTFRNVMNDSLDTWISQVVSLPHDLPIYVRRFNLPNLNLPSETVTNMLARLVEFCRAEWATRYPLPWSGAADLARGTPDVAELPILMRAKFGGSVTSNRIGSLQKRIAFVLPIYEFGGVEKVAYFVARSLRQVGYHVDLIVLGRSGLQPHERQAEAFDQTFFVDHQDFNEFGGPEYLGTHLPSKTYPKGCDYLTNLLSSYSVVVACHAASALGSFASLRKQGILTINYLHLLEYTDTNRIVGHPILGIAYEHATDLYFTCSERLSEELGMLGIPSDKIVTIPNAAGMDLSEPTLIQLLQEREIRSSTRMPLRILYLGRLDFQKGVDRVAAIFEVLKTEPTRFDLLAIGSAVIEGGAGIPNSLSNYVRPAVQTEAELANAYSWADVIILPSRYEGVPLTILEAQAHGVVPIVTCVGAVDEIVLDGVSGFVISQDRVVDDIILLLHSLEADRASLMRISEQAFSVGARRSWRESADIVHRSIESVFKPGVETYDKMSWLEKEVADREV